MNLAEQYPLEYVYLFIYGADESKTALPLFKAIVRYQIGSGSGVNWIGLLLLVRSNSHHFQSQSGTV